MYVLFINNSYMSYHSKNKSRGKFQRSPQKSTDHKLSRNLQVEFDNYSLRQQSAEYCDSDDNQQIVPQYHKQNTTTNIESKKKSQNNHSMHNKSLKNDNKQNNKQFNVPRSYLLAMQSLQRVVESKDQQIQDLKQILLEKEQYILQSQTRINQLLLKYEQITNLCEHKEHQIIFLKSQLKQARTDQENAIKQAAKAIQKNLIPQANINEQINYDLQQQLHRSRTMTMNTYQKYSKKLDYGQQQNNYEPIPSQSYINNQTNRSYLNSVAQNPAKGKRAQSTYNKSSNSHHQLLSHKSSAKVLYDGKNNNFISYQRQILRNQKQLIALNYRMQCLQRVLLQQKKGNGNNSKTKEQKNEETKKKIRQLRKQIDDKERILTKLRNV